MNIDLRDQLHRCAESGEWWDPGSASTVPAWWLRELVVSGKIPGTDRPVHAKGVRMRGAILEGTLDFAHAQLAAPMLLDRVEAIEPVVLVRATGSWISITNSHLAGVFAAELKLSQSLLLDNSTSSALVDLDGAQISGGVSLNKFVATDEVRLVGAAIGGQFACKGGRFNNTGNRALVADGAQISGGMFLSDGFEANGEVRLVDATIRGTLDCTKGSFTNGPNAALSAERASITGDLLLGEELDIDGEIRLVGATVDGQLRWQPKRLRPEAGVDLTACSVGPLVDDIESWPKNGRLQLDGFTYAGFSGGASWDVKARLVWLDRMAGFHSQPYEQLADVYRKTGRTVEAREVSIAREWARTEMLGEDREYRYFPGVRRGWLRTWHRVWGWSTRFGYEPARALWIFGAILAIAALFFWWAGRSGVMEPTDLNRTASATECTDQYPCYQPIIYATDVMVPIVNLGQRDTWTPDVARHGPDDRIWPWSLGETVRIATVLLIVLGWVLTAAFIAAVTRTISRS